MSFSNPFRQGLGILTIFPICGNLAHVPSALQPLQASLNPAQSVQGSAQPVKGIAGQTKPVQVQGTDQTVNGTADTALPSQGNKGPAPPVQGALGSAQTVHSTAGPAHQVHAQSVPVTSLHATSTKADRPPLTTPQSSQPAYPSSTAASTAGTSSEGTGCAGSSRTGTGSPRASATNRVILNPEVTPFVCGTSAHITETPNVDKGKKTGRGKAKTKSNKSGEEFNADFAKYETNVLQAKLREQELTIKDLRFKNNLLESRVEDLERKKKQDIYEKYFPKPADSTSSEDTINNTEHTGCCSRISQPSLSCCRTQHYPCHNQPIISCSATAAPSDAVKDVAKKIDEIVRNMDDLKYKIDVTMDITIPHKIRDAFNQYLSTPSLPSGPSSIPTATNAAGPSFSKAQNNMDGKSSDTADPAPNPSNVSNTTIDDAMSDISFDLN